MVTDWFFGFGAEGGLDRAWATTFLDALEEATKRAEQQRAARHRALEQATTPPTLEGAAEMEGDDDDQ